MKKYIASDELEPPKDAEQGSTYGPVPSANTAIEEQDEYPVAEFGQVANIPTTNVKGFFPYRGSEQHGVRYNHDTKTPVPPQAHYAAEQLAFENYVDPTITPRDLSPVPPIRVKIVDTPNLLNQRRADIRTVPVNAASGLMRLVGQDWNRVRLLITAYSNVASCIGYLKTKNDSNKSFDALKIIATNTGAPLVVLDTVATSEFWFAVDDVQAATDTITIGLYWERPVYDGENLIG